MEYRIRVADEMDFQRLIELFREFALFEKLPHKMVNSLDRMYGEKELFNGFIAETKEGQIVGYATFFYSYHTWIGKCLYMDDLYVKESFRKKGIGKKLLDSVILIAKNSNCHKVRWQVSNWNVDAQNFYKSIGAEIDKVELNCDLILD